MEKPQKRAFSEEHTARLKKGALRRRDEQVVGNYIRRSNVALFNLLLNEAKSPPSPLVEAILAALTDNSPPRKSGGALAHSLSVPNPDPPSRPPPPVMEIL